MKTSGILRGLFDVTEIVRDSERVRLIHQEIKAEQEKIALLCEHREEAAERNE